MECIERKVANKCACVLAIDKQFIRPQIIDDLQMKISNYSDRTDIFCLPEDLSSCVADLLRESTEDTKDCLKRCDPPCQQWVYKPSISNLAYPAGILSQSRTSQTYHRIKGNVVIVEISFPQLQYVEIVQVSFVC